MNYCKVVFTVLILLNVSFQQALMAQPRPGHVIPMEDLKNQLAAQSEERHQNIQEIQKLLRHDLVQKELGRLVDLEKVELALATLDDEKLQELATESREVNNQLEAGLAGWAIVLITVGVCVAVLFIVLAIVIDD
jgi:hypothetical protein